MVYFIQAEPGGPIKIGFTARNVRRRLANLQTANPYKLILLATTKHHQETMLHERFKSLRLHGEWFKPAVVLIAWIQRNALVTEEGHRQFGRMSAWKF